MDRNELYALISQLVMCHSPSGAEEEVDRCLEAHFEALGIVPRRDAAGNIIVEISGTGSARVAITAHKDEIGGIVRTVEDNGKVRVRKLGGSFPWVYGEGIVDLLGEHRTVSGVLSFGSRHVSHASPQMVHKEAAPVKWDDTWVETKLSADTLAEAGIVPGTRMVIGKHRKMPYRLGDYIASYALDNKASLAILLGLAARLKTPVATVFLVATANEEVGGLGGLYFANTHDLDAMIALEIVPVAPEYTVKEGDTPAIVAEDLYAPYDQQLNRHLCRAADAVNLPSQLASLQGFASDASFALRAGHVPRATCFGFPTLNTHGYEIAHLDAISRCIDVLDEFCMRGEDG